VIPLVLGAFPPDLSESDKKGVEKLKRWLKAPAATMFSSDRVKAVNKLKGANPRSRDFVCTLLTTTTTYTKTDYANALLDWVSLQVFVFLSILTL
jgi:truncated hemoglobin YjbI